MNCVADVSTHQTGSTAVVDPVVAHIVRRAAVRATLAPSIHNTQPWRFVLRAGALEVFADWSRRLRVLDPRGRQLTISCGCAVFNARVAFAAAGYRVEVARFPDPAQPHLLARLTVADGTITDGLLLSALDPVIELRRTNRRRFADDAVPREVVDWLVNVARDEGADLVPVLHQDHRRATARLSRQADELENSDPAYRAELRAWTTEDPRRPDGVPADAVPNGGAGRHDELPIRDFDTGGLGWLPVATDSAIPQCLVLLGTSTDTPLAWLQAGEALQRVLLEITRFGYAASPLTQVVEVAQTNALLRQELGLRMNPHVLLRVGRAPTTPAPRRRRLVDVLDDADLDRSEPRP